MFPRDAACPKREDKTHSCTSDVQRGMTGNVQTRSIGEGRAAGRILAERGALRSRAGEAGGGGTKGHAGGVTPGARPGANDIARSADRRSARASRRRMSCPW